MSHTCPFCGSSAQSCVGRNLYHPIKRDHGPFDFYRCDHCRSGFTRHPPTQDQLASLYASFRDGMSERHRALTDDDPQLGWYRQCMERVARLTGRPPDSRFRWIDVGAGGGELAKMMAYRFQNSLGVAVDMHDRPAALHGIDRVEWIRRDLNSDFAAGLTPADVVISTAVWEHVLEPGRFAARLLSLQAPGGLVYLVCPNYASLASRWLRSRWPYFTPGEHLNMPSPQGARRCFERELARAAGNTGATIHSRPTLLPYTVRYVLRHFGIETLAGLVPVGLEFPMPVGALETTLQKSPANGGTSR